MATVTPNFNFPVPQSTDLVKDGATAIAALGTSIDTQFVDLKGGTTGQVLAKASNTDLDYSWVAQDDSNAIQNAIVDAKGDLIAATAADTPARLAVGTNGQVLTADSTAATGLAWSTISVPTSLGFAAGKNKTLNSDFSCWQRGTSFAFGSPIYSADRWQVATQSNVSGRTVSRQASSLTGFQYCTRVARDSGNTSTSSIFLAQSFESINSYAFAGQTVTLSFYARAGANYSSISSRLNAKLAWGTGTDQNVLTAGFTGQTNAIDSMATLTTSWQRFTFTAAIGSTATQIGLLFTSDTTGTAGANDWYEITGVQVELGSVATAFQTATGTIQGELAACQRYYFRLTASSFYTPFGVGAAYASTGAQIAVNHPVAMRIGPSSMDYASIGITQAGGAINVPSSFTLSNTGPLNSMLATASASGLVAGDSTLLVANATTSAYLGFSAEL